MRRSPVRFAVRWMIVAVAFGVVLIAIRVGAMRGRSIHNQEMARRWAVEAEAAEAEARESESISDQAIEWISYLKIAREHADEVQSLDGLLHPYQEINGIVCLPLFTEDYYRDPEKWRLRWQRLRDWHARLAEKYHHAALDPSEPVPPDPPSP
jgi:hypothetical protein